MSKIDQSSFVAFRAMSLFVVALFSLFLLPSSSVGHHGEVSDPNSNDRKAQTVDETPIQAGSENDEDDTCQELVRQRGRGEGHKFWLVIR